MKLLSSRAVRLNCLRAYTLGEMWLAFGIFTLCFMGGMIGIQILGLREYTLGGTKLSAMSDGLQVLNQIRDDIRSSKLVDVGNLTTVAEPSTFTLVSGTNPIVGGALRVYPTTNSVAPVNIYYLDNSEGPNGTNYLRMASSTDGVTFSNVVILASYVTNLIVFKAQDPFGNVQTNYSNNRVIYMELDFYQWEYPVGYVGGVGANAYDYYKLTTRISRRLLD